MIFSLPFPEKCYSQIDFFCGTEFSVTGKNFDFQKIIILVLNVLELRPWSGSEEEARAFSYKLLSLSLNDPSGIYMESTAQLLKMVKNTGH